MEKWGMKLKEISAVPDRVVVAWHLTSNTHKKLKAYFTKKRAGVGGGNCIFVIFIVFAIKNNPQCSKFFSPSYSTDVFIILKTE